MSNDEPLLALSSTSSLNVSVQQKVASHLLILALGIGLGWTLHLGGERQSGSVRVPTAALPASASPASETGKAPTVKSPAGSVASAPVAPAAVAPAREPTYFEAMRKLDEAQRKHWLDVALNPVTPDGRLTRGAIALFELNEQQTAALEDTMKNARQRIDALEQSVASVKVGAEGREVTISIPAYASQAGEIYDDVFRAFAAVLGPDRYTVFEAAATPQLESNFRQFGERERTITITRSDKTEDDYEIRDAQKFAGGFSSSSMSGKKVEIVKQLGPSIQKLLPEDF